MAIDYVAAVQTLDAIDLGKMLVLISEGRQPRGWSKGKAFEHVVLRAFQLEGADIVWPYEVSIDGSVVEQIDGCIYADNLSCLIESKDYGKPCNVEPIAKLRNQLSRRPSGTFGLVFARNGFTEPAKTLTRFNLPLNILLWEFEELFEAVEHGMMRRSLVTKVRYAVEQGIPDWNIKAGLR